MTLHIELKDRQGNPLAITDGVVEVHELSPLLRLLVDVAGDHVPEAELGGRSLAWIARERCFRIDQTFLTHWVGGDELVVRAGDEETSLWLEVVPHPDKANLPEWRAMLAQLETWLGGVTVGQEAGRIGTVSQRGAPSARICTRLV